MSRPLIVIFGATGAQGGGLARALLQSAERPFRVRAVTRRPGSVDACALAGLGAEIIAADLDDPASVQRAMHGAYGAFCATSFFEHLSPERELAQADAMAEAAQRAGLRHVIWSTLEDTRRFALPTGRWPVPACDAKGQADASFLGRGLPLTRLLTSFRWETLVRCGLQGSQLRLPIGDRPLPGIAAADIGPCAAALFRQGPAAIGRRIGIAGEHLSGAQMARALARALGEPVEFVASTPAEFVRLGGPGTADLAAMLRFQHDFDAEVRAVRDVAATRALHPGLLRFEDWLATGPAEQLKRGPPTVKHG